MKDFKVYDSYTSPPLVDLGIHSAHDIHSFLKKYDKMNTSLCTNVDSFFELSTNIANNPGMYLVKLELSEFAAPKYTFMEHKQSFIIVESKEACTPHDLVKLRQMGADGVILKNDDPIELQYLIEICREIALEPIAEEARVTTTDARFALRRTPTSIITNPNSI
jgi:hypothetical protein